jgi:hypothetical protein
VIIYFDVAVFMVIKFDIEAGKCSLTWVKVLSGSGQPLKHVGFDTGSAPQN